MNAENLVNKKKLKARIIQAYGSTEEDWEKSKMRKIIKDCTLSPAELAGILKEKLKGDSWVLEELKVWLKEPAQESTKEVLGREMIEAMDSAFYSVLNKLEHLEFQAPISELAKQADEVRRKAEAWDKLQSWVATRLGVRTITYTDLLRVMKNKLLAQSKEGKP